MWRRFTYRFRLKYVLLSIVSVYVLIYLGAFTHLFELEFHEDTFAWPFNGDVQRIAALKRRGQPTDQEPINLYNYTFLKPCDTKCRTSDGDLLAPRLVFIVKSAMRNYGRRQAIRNTWGFERRMSNVVIRTVFVLGVANRLEPEPVALQHLVDVEGDQYGDVVQADFHDSYYNNTIKTMMGFRWAIQNCPRSQFYMFVDDDFYVSAKNVLNFVRNPVNYPEYLEEAEETLRKLARRLSQADAVTNGSALDEAQQVLENNEAMNTNENREYLRLIRRYVERHRRGGDGRDGGDGLIGRRKLMEMELAEDARLFSGFVFRSAPHRHRSSKWYVSLDEYPWHMWPAYVTAGAFVLSREALIQLYYASLYTKHFR